VLLVEDDSINQAVAKSLIESIGCAVTIAQNGKEAVSMMSKSGLFDLVFMDVHMPEMDGYEATKRIREAEKKSSTHTTIIGLTALAFKEDMEKCLAAGMDFYLSKPLERDKLIKAIKNAVNRR
jgi:CheY-like chemotaxis protein